MPRASTDQCRRVSVCVARQAAISAIVSQAIGTGGPVSERRTQRASSRSQRWCRRAGLGKIARSFSSTTCTGMPRLAGLLELLGLALVEILGHKPRGLFGPLPGRRRVQAELVGHNLRHGLPVVGPVFILDHGIARHVPTHLPGRTPRSQCPGTPAARGRA